MVGTARRGVRGGASGRRALPNKRWAQLDGMDNLITLPSPMDFRVCAPSLLIAAGVSLPQLCTGAVIFKAGEKAKYVVPSVVVISGNAEEHSLKGQVADKEGILKLAIRAYRTSAR